MSHTTTGIFLREKEFAAPDRPINAIAGSIPGHAEQWRFDFVLRHAGSDVGPMMLHCYLPTGSLQSVFR